MSLCFSIDGSDKKIFVRCTSDWTASTDAEWLKLSATSGRGDGTIIATAPANPSTDEYSGHITVTSGNSKVTLDVFQNASLPMVEVKQSSVFIDAKGNGNILEISSNTSWKITADDSWVSCYPTSGNGDATVVVFATAYSQGTRYSNLTIKDDAGENTIEIPVMQSSSPADTTALRNWLEKPMSVVDVDLKTASYYTIRNAIAASYKIDYESSKYQSLQISTWDNPSLQDLTYQGMRFSSVSIHCSPGNDVRNSFYIDMPCDYKTILNNIVQDFKFNLNVSLTEESSGTDVNGHKYEGFRGRDANGHLVGVLVRTYSDEYCFEVYAYYYQ